MKDNKSNLQPVKSTGNLALCLLLLVTCAITTKCTRHRTRMFHFIYIICNQNIYVRCVFVSLHIQRITLCSYHRDTYQTIKPHIVNTKMISQSCNDIKTGDKYTCRDRYVMWNTKWNIVSDAKVILLINLWPLFIYMLTDFCLPYTNVADVHYHHYHSHIIMMLFWLRCQHCVYH